MIIKRFAHHELQILEIGYCALNLTSAGWTNLGLCFGSVDKVTSISGFSNFRGCWQNVPCVNQLSKLAEYSSSVIDNLCTRPNTNNTSVLAYFYCDGNTPETQDVRYVLGGLLRQLLPAWEKLQPGTKGTSNLAEPMYEKYRELKSAPSLLRELQETLEKVVCAFEQVYILIDGLDEITEREHILALSKRLVAYPFSLNIIVVSRPIKDIESAFSGFDHLEIEQKEVCDDIKTYVQRRLNNDASFKSINSALKGQIQETLIAESAGMFLLQVI
jgi:hypothetical protein